MCVAVLRLLPKDTTTTTSMLFSKLNINRRVAYGFGSYYIIIVQYRRRSSVLNKMVLWLKTRGGGNSSRKARACRAEGKLSIRICCFGKGWGAGVMFKLQSLRGRGAGWTGHFLSVFAHSTLVFAHLNKSIAHPIPY